MFEKIKRFFNAQTRSPTIDRLEMVTQNGEGFYAWNGKLYDSDIVRSCIRPKAKAIGKLTAKHIRDNESGLTINPDVYMRFLLEEPNPFMTGQVFQEKMATQLQLNNNAFALIIRNNDGFPVELYPIPASGVDALYDHGGNLLLRCTMRNGKIFTFDYVDVIHIRQDFNDSDIFGTSPMKALKPLMEIVNTSDQGIVNAIKNSAVIRWLLKFTTNLNDDDRAKRTKEFAESFLKIDNTAGVAAVDGKMDATQVKPQDYVPNALQMDRTTKRIMNYFGTNPEIVGSTYDENQWNAYYEAEIEPVAVQMSGEYTRKLFTRRERGFGNSIIFEASSLQYASMTTKMNLYQAVDRGSMTPNEWRRILGNLAPLPGGDEPIRRLDTQPVANAAVIDEEEAEVIEEN